MKRASLFIVTAMLSSLVQAELLFSTDFTTNNGYVDGNLTNSAGWNAQAGFGQITNAATQGILEAPLANWSRAKAFPGFDLGTGFQQNIKVVITADFWFGDVGPGPGYGPSMAIGIGDAAEGPGGNTPSVYSHFTSWATGIAFPNWKGPHANYGTNAWHQVTVTIEKTETLGEFTVNTHISNLTSGVVWNDHTASIVNTNVYNAGTYNVAIRGLDASATSTTGMKWDNFKYEVFTKPQDVVIWSDDFATTYEGEEIPWRSGWMGVGNNAGWEGTTAGTMLQRPNLSTNQTGNAGWRGATYTGTAFVPEAGDTIKVNFDYTLFTETLETRAFLDLIMSTNNVMAATNHTVNQTYDQATSPMSFRIAQNAFPGPGSGIPGETNGSIRVNFADIGVISPDVGDFDPAIFGLAPSAGDHDGDVMAVTYALEKTTTSNVWNVSLSFSNKTSGLTAEVPAIAVTNASWYAQSNFYFAANMASGNPPGPAGNEFDNFEGILRAPAPPTGYDAWELVYSLVGDKADDDDLDTVSNWGEWVFDGDPTNGADVGTKPVIANGATEYIFSLRNDTNVTAHVMDRTNLTTGAWTTGTTVNVTADDFEMSVYTSAVDNTSTDELFLQLHID